jgi:hypothetical protein
MVELHLLSPVFLHGRVVNYIIKDVDNLQQEITTNHSTEINITFMIKGQEA